MEKNKNKYLNEKDLENIKNHKYQTTGYSKLDNLMNPWWNFCASLIPRVKNKDKN